MRTVESNIEDALSINHTLSLCNALAQAACPVALYAGDLAAAERFTAMLLDQTARHALDVWHAYGRCFKGMLLIKRGDVDVGLRLLGARSTSFGQPNSSNTTRHFSAGWRKASPSQGRRSRASRRSTRHWHEPSSPRSAGRWPNCCA
jgi:hypothetical protein